MSNKKNEGGVIKHLESTLEGFFLKKLPALPANIKEIIVKFGPWVALVGLVFSLPTIFAALGFSSLMMPGYFRNVYRFGGYSFTWWISIASMVLLAIALPGLFKRKMTSWRLMFYAGLVMALYYLITVNLGSLIIGTGISMYILFQIKSYYK